MLEQRKCLMWDVMLIIATHNYMAILKSMPYFKTNDLVKFRLQQIKGVIEVQGSTVLSHVCACPPTEPLPKPQQTSLCGQSSPLLGKQASTHQP
jgi:hypothetical protein